MSSGKGDTDKESTDQEVRSDILDDSDADPHFYPPGKDTANESSSSTETTEYKQALYQIQAFQSFIQAATSQSGASEEIVDDPDVEEGKKSQEKVSSGKDNGDSVAKIIDKESSSKFKQLSHRVQTFQSFVQTAASQWAVDDLDVEKGENSQQKVSSGKGDTDKESTDQEVRSDILDDSDADPHFYPPGKDTANESTARNTSPQTEDEEEVDEENISREVKNRNIYVNLVTYSETTKQGVSEWWFNAVSATEAIFTARTC